MWGCRSEWMRKCCALQRCIHHHVGPAGSGWVSVQVRHNESVKPTCQQAVSEWLCAAASIFPLIWSSTAVGSYAIWEPQIIPRGNLVFEGEYTLGCDWQHCLDSGILWSRPESRWRSSFFWIVDPNFEHLCMLCPLHRSCANLLLLLRRAISSCFLNLQASSSHYKFVCRLHDSVCGVFIRIIVILSSS